MTPAELIQGRQKAPAVSLAQSFWQDDQASPTGPQHSCCSERHFLLQKSRVTHEFSKGKGENVLT